MGDGCVPCTAQGPRSADVHDALLTALTKHQPLLAHNVRWAESTGLLRHHHQHEDAWQAARLGFTEAYRRYDASRGTSIGVFAQQYVKGAVRKALEGGAEAEDVSIPIFTVMDETVAEVEDMLRVETDTATRVEAIETGAAIRKFMAGLPRRQRYIVNQVFWEDRSQADVARDMGVSRKTITKTLQNLYARGRAALRPYAAA
jgi:RNA polymerase sigma factor (sigma-70 family)